MSEGENVALAVFYVQLSYCFNLCARMLSNSIYIPNKTSRVAAVSYALTLLLNLWRKHLFHNGTIYAIQPFTLLECLERDFSMTHFCINNAYVCACYLLCCLPGSTLITWWIRCQGFIEISTEVPKPKYMFHAVLNDVYTLYESMYRFEYTDSCQCPTMKCHPQDVFMLMKC